MRNWSIPAGRLFGVEIRIHLTFAVLLLFVLMTEAAADRFSPERVVALVVIIFLSVVIHELAHALGALHGGRAARAVVLLPIGGVTLMDETVNDTPNAAREIRVAAFGPLANLLIAFVGASIVQAVAPGLGLMSAPYIHSGHLVRSAIWINASLGIVNLLPAYPLDGGRILRAFFLRSMDPVRATRRAVNITNVVAMLCMLSGLLPIGTMWMVMVGFFLLSRPRSRSARRFSMPCSIAFAWKTSCSPTSLLSRPPTHWSRRSKRPSIPCKTIFQSFAAENWSASYPGIGSWKHCAATATATFSRS